MYQNKKNTFNGILVVSFGTTKDGPRARSLNKIQEEIQTNYDDIPSTFAYTSDLVICKLSARGVQAPRLFQGLNTLKEWGVTDVYVLPTHLLYGYEYEKIQESLEKVRGEFSAIHLAPPLLNNTDFQLDVIEIMAKHHEVPEDTALLLVGHGSEHLSNVVYPALDYMAKEQGFSHVFVATIDGYPQIDNVLPLLLASSYRKVLVAPLMVVAGTHASDDIASDRPDSVKSILEKAGFSVTTSLEGMGEIPKIREKYYDHLEEILWP